MEKITVRGKTFDSHIDDARRYADDPNNPYMDQDKEMIKRWEAARKSIEELPESQLKYLNENFEENQVLEDVKYYLADPGLWWSNPPNEHPTIEEEIARRQTYEAELIEHDKEQRKRDRELNDIRLKAIENNDYRNPYHPRFAELNNPRHQALNAISSSAFIEDFGTLHRVGGIELYESLDFQPPLWLRTAVETVRNYYMNCGGNYPYPEADYATVMYNTIASVNGSNAYLMAKNTAKTAHRPTHWNKDVDFGIARVVSLGRTMRYNGQCDEVLPSTQALELVILARRLLIKDFRAGKIKEISPQDWPDFDKISGAEKESVQEQKLLDHVKSLHEPVEDFIERRSEVEQHDIIGRYNRLIDDVYEYKRELHNGKLHVERWQRVLQAFGVEDYGMPQMTSTEAKQYMDRGWKRWEPVYYALLDIEGATFS